MPQKFEIALLLSACCAFSYEWNGTKIIVMRASVAELWLYPFRVSGNHSLEKTLFEFIINFEVRISAHPRLHVIHVMNQNRKGYCLYVCVPRFTGAPSPVAAGEKVATFLVHKVAAIIVTHVF